ncbi:MAG: S49 family peptidase, partial [Gammaproteobacteria bacterium]|nr:S49 family peptidase [Gammaproteobacteria bacterium]
MNQMDVTQQKTLLKNAGVTQKAFDGEEDEEPLDEHFMLDVQGSVGIVSITGSMTHEESRYNRYFGITSYGDIQNALASAVNNAQVSTILMDFDSPGGTVSGISEASDFIAMVDSKHKPVYAYTGSQMTSAAYWLGINGRDVSASRMAEIGSIGVIAVHTEFSELMKEIGITPTVLRAGKYKALGNPYEKLSDLAESEIQASLDEAYGFFTDHVASARGVSTQHVRESMAEGRVFRGERAKELGLIDNVESLNDVVTRLNEDNTPEQQGHHTPVYSDQPTILGNSMTTKRIVTEASQAAIASGASSDQVEDLMTTQT